MYSESTIQITDWVFLGVLDVGNDHLLARIEEVLLHLLFDERERDLWPTLVELIHVRNGVFVASSEPALQAVVLHADHFFSLDVNEVSLSSLYEQLFMFLLKEILLGSALLALQGIQALHNVVEGSLRHVLELSFVEVFGAIQKSLEAIGDEVCLRSTRGCEPLLLGLCPILCEEDQCILPLNFGFEFGKLIEPASSNGLPKAGITSNIY